MNKLTNIIAAKKGFYLLLITTAVVMLYISPKTSVNIDEQLHYPHAKNVVNWYFTGGSDTSCLDTPVTNLKYYGQSVDNFTALVNRVFNVNDEFLTRHITGVFFFVLLLLFAGLVTYQLTGNYLSSSITVLLIIFMPRLFGQAFGNLKDIPFATGYVASLFFILRFVRELPGSRWSSAILTGLSIAFTVSVRIGGLILFFYAALFSVLFFLLKPYKLKQIFSTKSCLVRLLGQSAVIVGIGYFAGLLFWPFALQDVWHNPYESLKVMEHYKVSIRQIFNGQLIWSTDLPWYYLPKWLFITTPEFVLLGMVIFTIFFVYQGKKIKTKSDQIFWESAVLFTFLFPAIYVMIIDANLYSGVRQVLFLLPVLAILSATGITKLTNINISRYYKTTALLAFFALMILPLIHQVKTFPVDYVYFNSVSGGNKNAWGNYEYDYYFHAFKKPAEALAESISGDSAVIVASNCILSNYFESCPNITFKYCRYLERSSMDWDFGLFGINYIHPFQLKNHTWQSKETVNTFFHKGNPVAVLLRRDGKKDFYGIRALENGNFESADTLLQQAIQKDPDNVWLYVNLAKLRLKEKEFGNFEDEIAKGKQIYPLYEPFFMLEALGHFDEKRFDDAYFILEELLEINPRYQPATRLLNELEIKVNK